MESTTHGAVTNSGAAAKFCSGHELELQLNFMNQLIRIAVNTVCLPRATNYQLSHETSVYHLVGKKQWSVIADYDINLYLFLVHLLRQHFVLLNVWDLLLLSCFILQTRVCVALFTC